LNKYLGKLDATLKHEVCLHAELIFGAIAAPIVTGACTAAPEACPEIAAAASELVNFFASDFRRRECNG